MHIKICVFILSRKFLFFSSGGLLEKKHYIKITFIIHVWLMNYVFIICW